MVLTHADCQQSHPREMEKGGGRDEGGGAGRVGRGGVGGGGWGGAYAKTRVILGCSVED